MFDYEYGYYCHYDYDYDILLRLLFLRLLLLVIIIVTVIVCSEGFFGRGGSGARESLVQALVQFVLSIRVSPALCGFWV